jgi:hypothetical protein
MEGYPRRLQVAARCRRASAKAQVAGSTAPSRAEVSGLSTWLGRRDGVAAALVWLLCTRTGPDTYTRRRCERPMDRASLRQSTSRRAELAEPETSLVN